jgi:chromosome transmission fidelity protein 4
VGRSRYVAVFYHDSEPMRDGTQKIGCMLMDGTTANIISQGSVSSISKEASLQWAGFSNDHALITMDSDGVVSMMVCASHSSIQTTKASILWEWVPMLDMKGLKKSSDDSFWPISVFDGKMICVPLKGGSKFPDATRRPITTTLGFRMPLAGGNNAKGYGSSVVLRIFLVYNTHYSHPPAVVRTVALEEVSIRAGIALHHKKVMSELGPDEYEATEQEYLALSAQVVSFGICLLFCCC